MEVIYLHQVYCQNAWNVNLNNGNVNNNNVNYNNNNVVSVSEFRDSTGSSSSFISKESLWEAYLQCLKNKKATASATIFRIDAEQNIHNLWKELCENTYYPTTSIAFITEGREVFAANFRDRCVHTWVAQRIIPLLERQFVRNTWNCRQGKGVLGAVKNVQEQIRKVSCNYTKDAWILSYDLSGFFMHINRGQAATRLIKFIGERYFEKDRDTLIRLIWTILTHAPEKDCIKLGTEKEWEELPERKSLFYNPGLPIGDLPSQLVANFVLDPIDHFINDNFEADRYVDDTILISDNKEKLHRMMPIIRKGLFELCGATVNPYKYKEIHWKEGIKYLGTIIREGKLYPSKKTFWKAKKRIRTYNRCHHKATEAQSFIASLNSYFGRMSHLNSEKERKKLLGLLSKKSLKYVTPAADLSKILITKKPRLVIRQDLRKNRREFNNLKYRLLCE